VGVLEYDNRLTVIILYDNFICLQGCIYDTRLYDRIILYMLVAYMIQYIIELSINSS
jgi:hypothetical protein